MKFRYRSVISMDSETGDPLLLMRPEIPVTVVGSRGRVTYSALVDTGADNVVFPRSVADQLGIDLNPSRRSEAIGFGGGSVALLSSTATLEIANPTALFRWSSQALFSDCQPQDDDVILLGYFGFLEFFQANFDGLRGWLELIPNHRLPLDKTVSSKN